MMTFEEFQQIVREQRAAGTARFIVPVHKRLSADLITPVSAFLAIRRNSRYSFLLESVEGGEKLARYSFLGKNPYRVVKGCGERIEIEELQPNHQYAAAKVPLNGQSTQGNIFTVLQQMVDAYVQVHVPELPRLTGGAVGYLGYDGVRLVERLPHPPPDELQLPDAVWCFYDTIIAFDHVKHQVVLIANTFIDPDTDLQAAYESARERMQGLERELAALEFQSPEAITLPQKTLSSNFSRPDFEAAVEKAKRYIYEGDIFQVVLSQRFSTTFTGDRFNLYRALRQVNPSPYLFYLELDEFALVGSSPEVLVRVENGRAEVLPIAGTRRRGVSPQEDRQLEMELLADPKERAEHLMLVDLGRNDLGRICDYSTVKVDRYAFVERYSHVMHIVSSVSGLLRRGRGPLNVLAACFPAGTVSGAPKVRAMEIIDELEPTKRGIYAGAVGYIDFSGNMDTCIAIRTMLVRGNTIYIQAGAGIVADSDPAKEYEETENKARALQQAILMASEGLL